MPAARFETAIPATERPHAHALDRAATGIGWITAIGTWIIEKAVQSLYMTPRCVPLLQTALYNIPRKRRGEVDIQRYSFFNFGSRWRWLVNAMPQSFYPPGMARHALYSKQLLLKQKSWNNQDHAVAQLVEALRYNPEGCGFDSRWCHWIFWLT